MVGLRFTPAAVSRIRTFSTKLGCQTKSEKKFSKIWNPKIEWTDEQLQILDRARSRLSLFITGSAGTGKTVLLQHIIKILRNVHGPSKVFVTASTGVAACALQGQTLHSFAGIGLGNASRETLLDRILMSKSICKRWKKAEALVIDEISMIDASMFDNLEYIARELRESDEVWGGIQLIITGDFFQLPPILHGQNSMSKEFAFEADCWEASFDFQLQLTKGFRQLDPQLIKLLEGIRKGETDYVGLQLLKQACSISKEDSSVVGLYPRIENVKEVNEERMKRLNEEIVTYEAADGGLNHRKEQLKCGIAPDRLVLCKGARVMLTKNLDIKHKLCNGSTGTVTGFVEPDAAVDKLSTDHNVLPVVKFDSGLEMVIKPQTWEIVEGRTVVAWRCQIPLILAWALSIHKCQGMTLDCLHTDLSRAFGYGMVYVALSRVSSLKGLNLSGFNPSKIKAHPKVLRYYERFQNGEHVHDYPKQNEDISSVPTHPDKTRVGEKKYHISPTKEIKEVSFV